MVVTKFLYWHYGKANKFIFNLILNFVAFAFHLFSFKFLLATLFAPWRRVVIEEKKPGFSLNRFFQNFSFNLISRFMGFIIRSLLIFLSLILALIFFSLGLLILLAWQFILPFTWIIYFVQKQEKALNINHPYEQAKQFIYPRLEIRSDEEYQQQDPADKKEVCDWYLQIKQKKDQESKFWTLNNLLKVKSIGSSLAFGYTSRLDQYVEDLSQPAEFSHQLVGRAKEIKQIENILSRSSQNNILLVGEPGVGKQTILQGLAKAISEKEVIPRLFYKRVLKLNMASVLGQTPVANMAREKFSLLLKEAEAAGNIVLVIDQLEKYTNSNLGIDLTSVLTPFLQTGKIIIIAVTIPSGFERYILPNQHILKYFETLEVRPPTPNQALKILKSVVLDLEEDKKVKVSLNALKQIIELSDQLITDIPFPEKAIDLLDQAIQQAENEGKILITADSIAKLVSTKTKVPVGALARREEEKLKNLEQALHKKVVDQNLAVQTITSAMQRARLGLADPKKPIGSFLFMGPTGVGKTETAKALSSAYFGTSKSMTRIDMSQFQGENGLQSLIGSVAAEKPGILLQEVRANPYGVLLLDEFEKANQEILNLFLTVFDEGYLKDFRGKPVSFKNLIIICTSNAAAEYIRKNVQDQGLEEKIREYVMQKNIFSPELLNRFDAAVVFKPLTPEHVKKIAQMFLNRLIKKLEKKGITLAYEEPVLNVLAEKGHSFEFGARPLKRMVADKIETLIAKNMLHKEIKKGQSIKLVVDEKTGAFKIIQESG
jgi:ATP-dependent Clp protease ATP-binding subunit ClpC